MTTVVSVAVLFAVFTSKLALDTTAELTTLGTAAPVAATVSASGGSELPEFKIGGCVHVTICAAAPHVQPVPTPLTYVEPSRQRIGDDDGVVLALPAGCVRNRQRCKRWCRRR